MNTTSRGLSFRINVASLILFSFFAGATIVRAQKIPPPDPLNRPGDPLSRDPRRPDMNDRELRTTASEANARLEVETALREAKEAFESKPPRYADAEACYLKAAKANPREARAYLGLGYVYAAQDRAGDAINALQKAIETKPKFAAAHFNLGMIYSAIGKKDEALKEYQVLQSLDKALAEKLKQAIQH
jgi:tetratricopeptide (TPR) repeat protein